MSEPLSPGDQVEYSVSYSVKNGPEEAWVKISAASSVREGETADEARYRISDWVTDQVTAAVEEIVSS